MQINVRDSSVFSVFSRILPTCRFDHLRMFEGDLKIFNDAVNLDYIWFERTEMEPFFEADQGAKSGRWSEKRGSCNEPFGGGKVT